MLSTAASPCSPPARVANDRTEPRSDAYKLAAMPLAVGAVVRRVDFLAGSGWTPPRLKAAYHLLLG